MSTTVDQRVVEMRFDNKNFENNVSTTLSTLDKLKQKLHLDGATKGLENVNSAAKKVDMSSLGGAVETVRAKFSALQVMGVTALTNLTNSAVNAGKRIVSSLTIEPVRDGFQEYEMMLNSIQTTMAGTGKSAKEVEAQLKLLDEYADKTVYSTSDMLSNLPKFTNAGVELEKATTAMIGIANATALAGGDASKASIAYYNLGQAIGTGYLSRMDYNSINNAGIATMEWKNQMVEAAIAQGTLTKVGEDAYKAGNKTLTLQQLFIDGLQEQWATTDVMMKVFEDYGDETTEIGKKSYAAAQDIKTYTQMMESLKATAGTGWKDTWQIVFGDLDQAKKFWTGITNFISKILTKMADFRNDLLGSAFGKSFSDLSKKIKTILEPAKKASESIKTVTKSVKDLSGIVDKVISGKFGNGKERFEALAKAGYNYCEVQNKVNEKLGNSFRYTKEQIAAQDKLIGAQKKTTESTEKLTKADKDRIKQVAKLTKEEAKALGYTEEQIEAFEELGKAAKKLGMPLDEFIDNLDEINGRWLMIESFKNIGKSLIEVFKSIGKAWADVFPPKSLEERSNKLFDLIAGFHNLTKKLIPTEETAKNLERTFAGLFATLDIVRTLMMGPLSIAFKIVREILGAFNLNILDGLAYVGDMIVKFRDWLKSVLDFNGIFEKLIGLIKGFVEPIKDFFKKVDTSSLENATKSVKEFIDSLNVKESIANNFKKIIDGLKAAFDLGKTLWSMSLVTGLKILSAVLSLFGTDLLEIGGKLADWIVGLRDAVKEHTIFIGYVDKLAKIIHTLIEGVEKVVQAFLKLEPVQKIIQSVKDAIKGLFGGMSSINLDGFVESIKRGFDKLLNWIEGLKDSENIGKDIINGIIKGIGAALKHLVNTLMNLGKTIISTICDVLGIQSPSKEGKEIGKNVVLGLIEGLLSMVSSLVKSIGNIASSLLGSLKSAGATVVSSVLWVISSIFTKNPIWNIGAAFFGLFASMGENASQGFVNGISSSFSSVITCITNLASNVIDAFKNMLGIHSPSRVFMTLGKFLIAGLILGIVGQQTGLLDTIKNIASKVITYIGDGLGNVADLIKDITSNMPPIKWEYILGVGALVGAIIIVKKIMGIVDKFADGVAGFGKACSGAGDLMKALANKIDPQKSKFENFGDIMLKLAISVAILAGSVYLLAQLKTGQLWSAVGAVAALAVVVVGIAAIFNKLGKTMTIDVKKISGLILAVSTSMLLLAGVSKILAGMNWGELAKAGAGLLGFGVIITGLIWATKLAGKDIDKVGPTILKISLAMILLTTTAKIMSGMTWDDLARAGVGLLGLGAIVTGLIAATKLAGKDIDKVGLTIRKVATALLLLVITAKIVAGMDWSDMIKAGVGLVGLGAIVTGLIAATKLAGKDIDKVGPTILKISAAMLLLTITAKIIAGMSWGEMAKAAVGLVGLGAIVTGLIWATKFATDKELARVTSTLLAISVCMGILGLVSAVLSIISVGGLLKGVTAVTVLGLVVKGMIEATRGATEVKGTIMMIAVAIGVMAGAIVVLSLVDGSKLAGATIALATVMGMFALIIKFTQNIQNAIGTLAVMTVAIGMLAGCLYLIGQLPAQQALAAAGALSMVLLAMSAAMVIIGKLGTMSPMAMASVAVMTLVVAGLGGIIYLLSGLPVETTIGIATALSTLLLALSAACLILTVVGLAGPAALIGVGSLMALVLGIGGLLVAVGALFEYFPSLETFLDKGLTLLKKLATGLGEVVGGFVAGLTNSISECLPRLGVALGAFMVGAAPFITGIKMVDGSVLTGIGILTASILLLTAADLINGIASFLGGGSSFASLGTELSQFMINAMPFITGVKLIDPAAIAGVRSLAETVLILTAADVLDGLTSWFTGGSSIAKFGEEIAAFGPHLKAFADSVAGINPEEVTAAANAAKALSEMADTIPNEGGVIGWFSGENSLAKFGGEIAGFGKHLKAFADNVAGINPNEVTAAANAAKSLTDMCSTIPNEGGVVGWFAGENSLAKFGEELASFGPHLKAFGVSVAGVDVNAVKAGAEAGKALTSMADTIPNEGGVVGWFAGENSISKFGNEIVSFGRSLLAFSIAVTGINTEAIISATNASKSLVDLTNMIPNEGGVAAWFAGENSIAKFGAQIVSFGQSFAQYSLYMAAVDPNVVTATSAAAQSIVKLANSIPEDKLFKNETTLDEFGRQLASFGSYFASYYKKISGIDAGKLGGSITQMNRLVKMAKGMVGLDTDAMSGFGAALNKLGNTGVSNFIKAFTNAESKVKSAGSKMINAFVNGAKSKTSSVTKTISQMMTNSVKAVSSKQNAFKNLGVKMISVFTSGIKSKASTASKTMSDMAVKMVEKARGKYDSFKNAGGYLVKGFAAGITKNTYIAEARSRAMAKAALKAAQKALRIESPSKVARDEVGKYFVQGVAEGITEDMSAEEASAKKAENITDAFKEELDKRTADASTLDLEYQLWEKTTGLDASELEKSTQKLALLNSKLRLQAEEVELAKGEYQVTIDTFGKTSDEAHKAYDKLLNEQIALADLSNEISDLQSKTVGNTPKTFDKYAEYLKANFEAMVQEGLTLEEMQKEAAEATGWDLKQAAGYNYDENGAIKGITEAVTGVGEALATSIDQGVAIGSAKVADSTSTMVQSCADTIKAQQPSWIESGKHLADGFIQGIRSKISNLSSIADEIANSINTQPVIRPVLDLTDIQNGANQLNSLFANRTSALANSNMTLSSENISEINAAIDKVQKINDARGSEIVSAITELRGDFNNLVEAINNMDLTLDGNAVVGGLIGKIDAGLGQIASHKGRGI